MAAYRMIATGSLLDIDTETAELLGEQVEPVADEKPDAPVRKAPAKK